MQGHFYVNRIFDKSHNIQSYNDIVWYAVTKSVSARNKYIDPIASLAHLYFLILNGLPSKN